MSTPIHAPTDPEVEIFTRRRAASIQGSVFVICICLAVVLCAATLWVTVDGFGRAHLRLLGVSHGGLSASIGKAAWRVFLSAMSSPPP